jgi:uncharacterized membrane protein
VKLVMRWLLTIGMVLAGLNHFRSVSVYAGMMPAAFPDSWDVPLVYISGVFEILGGLGLILPATRRFAGWGIIALLVAVFPANLNMALNHLPLGDTEVPQWMLWARLPLQLPLIACAWYVRA